MACPLSVLLNPRDLSPIRKIHNCTERGDVDLDIPSRPINIPPDDIIWRGTATKHAMHRRVNGYRYPVILSNKKGSLYRRRAARFPKGRHDLSTPPRSSPLLSSQRSGHCQHHHHHELDINAGPKGSYDPEPPTPELDFRRFSIFKALHAHPELVFELARHLDVDDLISLYAISVDFHQLVDARFTTMIRNQAEGRALESARIFVFRCYKHLCIRDPASRPLARIPHQARFVPSFRWLRMIVYREHVVDEITACLAAEGLFLPPQASVAIKKLWFTLDISDTVRRMGLVHNKRFWTDDDLLIATMFFIKLDMRLTNPRTGNGELGLRHMLLAQPSLSTLLRVLQRQAIRYPLDMVRMFVRWGYRPRPRFAHLGIMDVSAHDVGSLRFERRGAVPRTLAAVDTLIARETVLRQMNVEAHLIDMIIYGFIDKRTFLDRWHSEAVTDEEAKMDLHSDDDVDDSHDENHDRNHDENNDNARGGRGEDENRIGIGNEAERNTETAMVEAEAVEAEAAAEEEAAAAADEMDIT